MGIYIREYLYPIILLFGRLLIQASTTPTLPLSPCPYPYPYPYSYPSRATPQCPSSAADAG